MRHPGLLNDILFKIVFGSRDSEPVLRALLNALLSRTGTETIVSVEVLNPGFDKQYTIEKGPVLDVKARDQAGRQYNIEVQLNPGVDDYAARSIFYTAKFFCDQLERGDPYHSLRKTVSISLLDFDLFPERENLHSTFRLWEPRLNVPLLDLLELHYIELRKFSPEKPQELRTRFERWLYLLKFADLFNFDKEALPETLAQEEGIPMAIDSMRKAYARDEVREMIEAREKAERDHISRLRYAEKVGLELGLERGLKQGLEQGREQGLEQGREQGREQGLEQGREQGLEQGREQGHLEALKAAVLGMTRTGLSREQILMALEVSPAQLDDWLQSQS